MQVSDLGFIQRGLVETNWQDILEDQKKVLERSKCDEKVLQDFERWRKTKRFKFRVFVAVGNGGEPVGYVSVAELTNPTVGLPMGGVLDLYVEPSSRRLGIGGKLLDHAIQFVRKEGYSHASLLVSSSNKAGMGLYESRKFHPDRIWLTRRLR